MQPKFPIDDFIGKTLSSIDEQVAARSLLSHPFYQAWSRGELTRAALKDYAEQYYRHVAAFPTYLSALHSRTEDAATRRCLLNNLMDEEGGSPNHPELWLQFAAALGLDPKVVDAAEPWAETQALIDTYRKICRERPVAEGVAALYAYESQIPAVAESKIAGLQRFYAVDTEAALGYFRVHLEADVEHSAAERRILCEKLSEANAPAVKKTVNEALAALWEILSGVCRRHAIAC